MKLEVVMATWVWGFVPRGFWGGALKIARAVMLRGHGVCFGFLFIAV
jgi:hypothetical protein